MRIIRNTLYSLMFKFKFKLFFKSFHIFLRKKKKKIPSIVMKDRSNYILLLTVLIKICPECKNRLTFLGSNDSFRLHRASMFVEYLNLDGVRSTWLEGRNHLLNNWGRS